MTRSFAFTSLFAALLLAGCATAPPPVDTQALQPVPVAFKEQSTADAGSAGAAVPQAGRWTVAAPADAQPRGRWWSVFNDPVLDDLVQRAGERNTSLQTAAARLAQAQSLLLQAQAQRRPVIDLAAGANRATQPLLANRPFTQDSLAARLNWEVDLSGRLARASDAASLDAEAQAALLESTRLMVQASVAQTYLALRGLDAERAIVADTLRAQRDTLRLTERRLSAGDVGELDAERVKSELAGTESDALSVERQRQLLEHALAQLLGEPASGFALAATDGAFDTALPAIPAGLPATVLARRPDVASAQRRLLAAQARIGVAQAAWFPSLSLTTSAGTASPDLGDLLRWSSRAWGLGALLSLPIFDGGRRDAGIANARAEFDGAAAGYREQVLVAVREVEDELASLRLLRAQAEAQTRAVAAAARATALSGVRYRNGLIGQLELLDAQRSELRNRRQQVQVRAAQAQATVGLIRALGGGWERG
ncbi:efflux transporter outer membrane subunit [Aquabacterium sp. J223]|uniref:efflux transporter outer membrane subunit n=1 Tax=Aquabacterium sp. J223 TaxID=2898431 RepID=UPI0021ADF4DF|nr:efflux transporter outer membrane subunit [Aquabacterium sp. J223]UUX95493.1 efflux transporter outer membrane subunit [Aquabacterium sp. J223]